MMARHLTTTEQLLALPDDGIERWLIRGRLREKQPIPSARPMRRVHDRQHSRIMARVVYLLEKWLESQTMPRGEVLCGEAGCRLRRNPDSTVGIDVTYIAANLAQQESTETTLIDGVPVLAVEILSPSDTVEEINEKIDAYLHAGVALVWIIDPHDQTVTIYRVAAEPALVTIRQELSAEPHLPGFRVAAAEIFA
jgi:Uma2 family endonuclease